MRLAQDDDVVHTLAPDRSDQQSRATIVLSLSKTLSGEDSPELWNRGMLAGDGCDPQAADRGATQLYYVARAA